MRASGGSARRTNSANPLDADALISPALIESVEAFYALRRLPVYFRVPDIAPSIDPLLEARGYHREGRTHTFFAALADLAPVAGKGVAVADSASDAWFEARDAISASGYDAAITVRSIIARISHPRAFVSIEREGRIVSLLLGVRVGDLVVPEAVMTHPDWRGQGLAGSCMAALVAWARAQGCTAMALQVEASNAAALATYRRLGLSHMLYGYHYRRKP